VSISREKATGEHLAEGLVGVVQDVLIGPWYGGVYDLLLTDQRFLLLFVEKFGMKTNFEPRSPESYEKESIDVLASRERSSSILYSAVKTVRQKGENETLRKLKLMLPPIGSERMHVMSEKDLEKKLAPIKMDEEVGLELLLSKAMPGMTF
jgi:hypothetical protein